MKLPKDTVDKIVDQILDEFSQVYLIKLINQHKKSRVGEVEVFSTPLLKTVTLQKDTVNQLNTALASSERFSEYSNLVRAKINRLPIIQVTLSNKVSVKLSAVKFQNVLKNVVM